MSELAAADPHHPAITCAAETVTRIELEQRSNRLAHAMLDLGVTQGDFVTLGLPTGPRFLEACIATWKVGAIPQPIASNMPPKELAAIIELADPSLVIGVDGSLASGRRCLPADYGPDPSLPDTPPPDVVSPSFKAPTSGGSTGRPKLIVATQKAQLDPESPLPLRLEPEGAIVVPAPLHHNAPFGLVAMGLFAGNHVVVSERFDAETTLALVEKHRAYLLYLVPTMMLRIWRLEDAARAKYDLSSLHTVWHMAAPCPAWLKESWIHWLGGDRVWELYGGTEGQAITIINGAEWLAHRGSVGRAARGEMKVFDAEGIELPPGDVGEIYMRPKPGTPLPYRYIGATARVRDGWESLGDLGYIDADGYVYLADRRTDLILVGGANVYPAEVEAAIEEYPGVVCSVAVGLPDEDLGERVHAIVQVEAEGSVVDTALMEHLKARLIKYKLPRSVELTTETLRDDAGKVRRSALRDARIDTDAVTTG